MPEIYAPHCSFIPPTNFPLPLNGLTLLGRLLELLALQTPSAQERRGRLRLDEARKLARDNEKVISLRDMEAVEDRLTLYVLRC
jgi:hypothetical protein